jgi:hypothetical protein
MEIDSETIPSPPSTVQREINIIPIDPIFPVDPIVRADPITPIDMPRYTFSPFQHCDGQIPTKES